MDTVNRIKGCFAAVAAVLTALWGWFGWLVLAWIGSMMLDYITGTCAALKSGAWSSARAREGAWHKLGAIVAVLVTALMDIAIGQIIGNIPAIHLPFTYSVFLCPMVVTWYIITEAGSIVENAGALGAPIPGFLRRAIEALRDKVEQGNEKEG